VYSLADLRERLAADPAGWVGRTVVLRASAMPCPWWGGAALACGGRSLVLVAADPTPTADPLPMERSASPALLVAARRVPLLARLLPPPPPLPLFTPMRLRLQVQALPPGACGQRPCYEALVLSVATG
jgi:hypothetical protein